MNYNDLNAHKLLHALTLAGESPHPNLIKTILARRTEMEPLLLALFADAYDDWWPTDDDPRWFRFVHAGKFMIHWQNEAALPIFSRLYLDEALQDMLEWFEEDPVHYGPPAIPFFKEVVEAECDKQWHYGRGLAGAVLMQIATYFPETCAEVTAIFQSLLPSPAAVPAEKDEMWGDWAMQLGVLAHEPSREQILALDDAGVLAGDFFEREYYLRDLNRGFQPQEPPALLDILQEYTDLFEWYRQREKALEKERKREQPPSRMRQVTPRSEPKIGRNAPCPCGSGKKYKRCHGRPSQ